MKTIILYPVYATFYVKSQITDFDQYHILPQMWPKFLLRFCSWLCANRRHSLLLVNLTLAMHLHVFYFLKINFALSFIVI